MLCCHFYWFVGWSAGSRKNCWTDFLDAWMEDVSEKGFFLWPSLTLTDGVEYFVLTLRYSAIGTISVALVLWSFISNMSSYVSLPRAAGEVMPKLHSIFLLEQETCQSGVRMQPEVAVFVAVRPWPAHLILTRQINTFIIVHFRCIWRIC